MDERFAYLDDWAERAASIERNFIHAMMGSKEGAISRARNAALPYKRMIERANDGFVEAMSLRNTILKAICVDIANESVAVAESLVMETASQEVRDLANRHVRFVVERLERDGERRVEQYQLDMKRIALIARSMRDDNSWDASSSLLRARESVDLRSQQSMDTLGRKQLTERFSKLMVRGLGVSCLVDAVVMISGAERFDVMTFDNNLVRQLAFDEFEVEREHLFHPQCNRYLVPSGK